LDEHGLHNNRHHLSMSTHIVRDVKLLLATLFGKTPAIMLFS
jgi:hypothetical protein